MVTVTLAGPDETRELGALVGRSVADRAVVALAGPLGAGKTTFVQGLGSALGVAEPVTSPTFTMLNEYHSGRIPLYHIDLYRLKDDPTTAKALGGPALPLLRAELEEFAADKGVVVIEWAEQLGAYLPVDRLSVELDYVDRAEPERGRLARLSAGGEQACALLAAVAAGHKAWK